MKSFFPARTCRLKIIFSAFLWATRKRRLNNDITAGKRLKVTASISVLCLDWRKRQKMYTRITRCLTCLFSYLGNIRIASIRIALIVWQFATISQFCWNEEVAVSVLGYRLLTPILKSAIPTIYFHMSPLLAIDRS